MTSSPRRVVGREPERSALRTFASRQDGPGALVLDGEAGVGKSTLWEEALRDAAASGRRVLRCRPTPSETQLAFAGIADLLRTRTLTEAMAALPGPQRRALAVALLHEEARGAPPDVRAIAAGLLGLMRHFAGQGPVVLAIDDVQWLDASSRSVLEFAARRVPDIQVVMLVARRSAADEPLPLGLSGWHAAGRVAHLRLGPMGLGVLDQLLRSRLELALSRPWLIRLGESSGGNPFYALELGRALQRRGLPDVPDGSLPLPGNLQSVVSDRLTELPGDVMELLRRVEMCTTDVSRRCVA